MYCSFNNNWNKDNYRIRLKKSTAGQAIQGQTLLLAFNAMLQLEYLASPRSLKEKVCNISYMARCIYILNRENESKRLT